MDCYLGTSHNLIANGKWSECRITRAERDFISTYSSDLIKPDTNQNFLILCSNLKHWVLLWIALREYTYRGTHSIFWFFNLFFCSMTENAGLLVSGGRPEGSKRNLKFQSAMWHHFKHFQSKDFFFLLPFFHNTWIILS
jgi:hypothetical protein